MIFLVVYQMFRLVRLANLLRKCQMLPFWAMLAHVGPFARLQAYAPQQIDGSALTNKVCS